MKRPRVFRMRGAVLATSLLMPTLVAGASEARTPLSRSSRARERTLNSSPFHSDSRSYSSRNRLSYRSPAYIHAPWTHHYDRRATYLDSSRAVQRDDRYGSRHHYRYDHRR